MALIMVLLRTSIGIDRIYVIMDRLTKITNSFVVQFFMHHEVGYCLHLRGNSFS